MNGKFIFLLLIVTASFSCIAISQTANKAKSTTIKRGLEGFPELRFTHIPGAPQLTTPVLLTGEQGPLISRGFGLAAPAFWDMNDDGLKDLLIGEFGSGLESSNKIVTGNYIRMYYNDGSETEPHFQPRYSYARPPYEYSALGNGTPYSVDQACCIGFTPQFVDLNADGEMDMVTGQYDGEVSWFKGTSKGFMPGIILPQEGGDPRGEVTIASQNYWLFSSASFGDFTNDGLPDLITGGASLRISKNIGTKEKPLFSKRELLLDIAGRPLEVYHYTDDNEEFKFYKKSYDDLGVSIPTAGNGKVCPYVVDWDNDGLLDLLVTNSYSHSGLSAVDFFKGVKINNEYRFQQAKPLFITENDSKAFPGSGLRVFVTDFNGDGINDLLLGASVALMRDKFNDRLAWNWERDMHLSGAGKDPAYLYSHLYSDKMSASYKETRLRLYKEGTKIPSGISFDDFNTIYHAGYVYLIMGKK